MNSCEFVSVHKTGKGNDIGRERSE